MSLTLIVIPVASVLAVFGIRLGFHVRSVVRRVERERRLSKDLPSEQPRAVV